MNLRIARKIDKVRAQWFLCLEEEGRMMDGDESARCDPYLDDGPMSQMLI